MNLKEKQRNLSRKLNDPKLKNSDRALLLQEQKELKVKLDEYNKKAARDKEELILQSSRPVHRVRKSYDWWV